MGSIIDEIGSQKRTRDDVAIVVSPPGPADRRSTRSVNDRGGKREGAPLEGKARLLEARRSEHRVGVVGGPDSLDRDAEKVRVELAVSVLVVEGRDGVRPCEQTGKFAHRASALDFGRNVLERGFEERLFTIEERTSKGPSLASQRSERDPHDTRPGVSERGRRHRHRRGDEPEHAELTHHPHDFSRTDPSWPAPARSGGDGLATLA